MLDYRIDTFLTVCETLNYTKAAQLLNLTQPAVSQHIHSLEKKYNVTLFFIEGKHMHLTPQGELLRQTALAFSNDEKIMAARMQEGRHQLPLYIGATVTIGEFVLPVPLARLLEQEPELEIHLTVANTAELLGRLRDGSIHLALVEGFFNSAFYDSMPYSTEEFIPVCSSRHVFTKEPHCLQDLRGERLLLRENGSGTRLLLEKGLELQNDSISAYPNRMEVNSMYAILQLLLADAGISFLYRPAVAEALQNHRLREIHLQDLRLTHNFTFIWNKGSIFAEQYRQLCRQLKLHI